MMAGSIQHRHLHRTSTQRPGREQAGESTTNNDDPMRGRRQ
jgi:hypothetical protein